MESTIATSSLFACTIALAAGTVALAQPITDYVGVLPLPVPNDSWVWAGSPPGDTSRLFVMEGGGTVRVLDIARTPGQLPVYTLRATPFVSVTTNQARSVAFAPDFATSGKVYVGYEIPGNNTRITEFTVSASNPGVVDPASARVVREFTQLYFDHALGSMHFGRDGMLYIGTGDGQNSSNAQSVLSPYGKMLRIDVLSGVDDFPAEPFRNYRIPPGNPLLLRPGAMPEIWHIGLRNPWRWSFDRWNGDMWICDVGASRPGEIDRFAGVGQPYCNLGWTYIDGVDLVGGALNTDFTAPRLYPPLLSIVREAGQCSTSGGVMYRGNDVRPWRGRFVWSDACSGQVYSAEFDGAALGATQSHAAQLNSVVTGQPVTFSNVSMVAEDGAGELYILQANRGTSSNGQIYRVVAAGTQPLLADTGQQGGIAGADGVLDNNDFVVYIDWFFSGSPKADIGKQGGLRGVDQRLDNNDFIVFIDAFFTGN